MTSPPTTQTAEKHTPIIDRSNRNRKLMKPVVTQPAATRDALALDVQRYIIESLSSEIPSRILFALRNQSLVQLAKYLKYDRSASPGSLIEYTYNIHRFCQWAEREPDDLIAECRDPEGFPNPKAVARASQRLDQYYMELEAHGLAPKTVGVWVAIVKSFYRTNGIDLSLTKRLCTRVRAKDRAPTPQELTRLLEIADLRERVIVSCLALGGFRKGTLSKLRYRHIKTDFESGITPIHVHVEAEITKGKYHDYDTFLGREAVEYLRAYLETRRRGSSGGRTPPEVIHDESPLIRDKHSRLPKPILPGQIYAEVHSLYRRAGLLTGKRYRRYELRPHSIRKFFRTQLAALGVDRDYIEHMLGHKVSTYHDIRMKGVEFLRSVYAASGLSIRPRTQFSRIDALKEIIRAWGMIPEEILTEEALSRPNRVGTQPGQRGLEEVEALSLALKEMMRKELLDTGQHKTE